jgi:hypothetical protein
MPSILRAFENDAFISHNSFDAASNLAGALEEHGTKVFCDETADVSDRRVRDRIGAALMRSRCVVVHIPADFRDSEWCRAEYEHALHLGQSLGFVRVVVARGSDTATLPPSLNAVPQFNLPHEMGRLAEFLIRMNTVPEEIAAEVQAQRNGLRGPALGADRAARARGTELLGAC